MVHMFALFLNFPYPSSNFWNSLQATKPISGFLRRAETPCVRDFHVLRFLMFEFIMNHIGTEEILSKIFMNKKGKEKERAEVNTKK